jgi:hypothetical protein
MSIIIASIFQTADRSYIYYFLNVGENLVGAADMGMMMSQIGESNGICYSLFQYRCWKDQLKFPELYRDK